MSTIIKYCDGAYTLSDWNDYPILFTDAGQADQYLRDAGYREEGMPDEYTIVDVPNDYLAEQLSIVNEQMYISIER